ncbi:transposase [Enterococcus faecalis]|nr:transposase [Enterococcus faecalis]MCO5542348.1 transposase [Enterococcus faecalis]
MPCLRKVFLTCQLLIKQLYEPKKNTQKRHHALNYSYSNGQLECLNNHIKVLKQDTYGFRNFYNFNCGFSSNKDKPYKPNKKVQRIFSSGLDMILQFLFTNII